jgi:hypothetical protein
MRLDAEQKLCSCDKWYPYYFGDLMICNNCRRALSEEQIAITRSFWREHKASDFLHDEMYDMTELEACFGSWMMGQQRP